MVRKLAFCLVSILLISSCGINGHHNGSGQGSSIRITSPNNGEDFRTKEKDSIVISGVCEKGVEVSLSAIPADRPLTNNCVTDGTWSFESGTLSSGANTFSISASDYCIHHPSACGSNENSSPPSGNITITADLAATMAIRADKTTINTNAGTTANLHVVFFDIDGAEIVVPNVTSPHSISWTNDNHSVATVDGTGSPASNEKSIVTAKGNGTTRVYVDLDMEDQDYDYQGNTQAYIDITVTDVALPTENLGVATSMSLSIDKSSINVGDSTYVHVHFFDAFGAEIVIPNATSSHNIHWTSDDESIATVVATSSPGSGENAIVLGIGGGGPININAELQGLADSYGFTGIKTASIKITVEGNAPPAFTCPEGMEKFTAGSVSFCMASVPGGLTFPTGTDDSGTAELLDGYQIGETEVTYELWSAVSTWALANGYTFTAGHGVDGGDDGKTPGITHSVTEPVTNINWYDALVFTNAVTEWYNAKNSTSYTAVYKNAGTTIRDATDTVTCDAVIPDDTATGFRLPRSNEWELAARWRGDDATNTVSGYTNPYFTKGNSASGATADYTNSTATEAVGWYADDSGGTTHAVKGKNADALGLYDMCGNVWEWHFDLMGGVGREGRGGSWRGPAQNMQMGAINNSRNPNFISSFVGFRLSRTVDTTPPVGGNVYFSQADGSDPVTVSWDQASDDITLPINLQYKLVKALSASDIDTVTKADAVTGADVLMDWTPSITSTTLSNLNPSTTYYFAVLVKDEAGNKTLYSNRYFASSYLSTDNVDRVSMAIDANNVPYVGYRDNGSQIAVMSYDTGISGWNTVFSTLFVDMPFVAVDSSNVPYVAYLTFNSGDILTNVRKYDSATSTWLPVGTDGFYVGDVESLFMAIDSNNVPYVAFIEGRNSYKATVMKYDDGTSAWIFVGTPNFSAGGAMFLSLVFDSNNVPYVAYIDNANSNKATVMRYDDGTSAWVPVGGVAGISAGDVRCTSIAIDSNNVLYVAYVDSTNSNKVTVMKYDTGGEESEWIPVGTAGISNIAQSIYISMAIDANGIPYVTYTENPGILIVMKFDGKSWVTVGMSSASVGERIAMVVDSNSIPYVAVTSSNGLSISKFGGEASYVVPSFTTFATKKGKGD